MESQAFARARRANGSSVTISTAWRACRIAVRGPIGCASRRRSRDRAYRSPAPSAHAGQGDRRPGRRLGSHREPALKRLGLRKPRPWSPPSRPAATSASTRRAHPHPHQEARSLQHSRPPRQGRAPRGVAQSSGRWESSMSASTSLAHRLQPDQPDERKRRPSPSSRSPSPTTKASVSPSSAS